MDIRKLCVELLLCDNEHGVVRLLQDAHYWEDQSCWRPIGDSDNNRSVVGNQQEDAVSALAEKITNSVDAVLINRCLEAGIDPTGPNAPVSMNAAIAKFVFKNVHAENVDHNWNYWREELSRADIDQAAKFIYLSATGTQESPSITVADRGEGQTPDKFPETFMSLIGYKTSDGRNVSQKMNIPFVQGQFNMGGSGVYPHASKQHGLQLLISRRNPALLPAGHSMRDRQWAFTVVRRSRTLLKGSVYQYLAPVDASDKYGAVLSFDAETMPLLPESPPQTVPNLVYSTEVQYGTLVKLYQYIYKETGLSTSHILRKSGLMRQLELVLPDYRLPIRVVEGRVGYKGALGSFQNNLTGIIPRLEKNFAQRDFISVEDIESDTATDSGELSTTGKYLEGAPIYGELFLDGTKVPWSAFVFMENAGDRTRNGKFAVIFQVNGQKHAHLAKNWLSSRSVGYSFFAKQNTLLVVVDCTALSTWQLEEVFKPNRSSMQGTELSAQLIDLLSDALKTDERLQKLQNQQHQRRQEGRLQNTASMRSVLEHLLKSTPMLARFFKIGSDLRIPKPFPGAGDGSGVGQRKFEGRKYPTYFRFAQGTTEHKRQANLGSKVRLSFETDAEDGYLTRPRDHGTFSVALLESKNSVSGSRSDLKDGVLTYNFALPEGCVEGDTLKMVFSLSDPMPSSSFQCLLELRVCSAVEHRRGGAGIRRNSNADGGPYGGRSTIGNPNVQKCCRQNPPRAGCISWPDNSWNEYTAVEIEENPETLELTYMVNVDNIYLSDYQKQKITVSASLIETKFTVALYLMALSVVTEHERQPAPSPGDEADSSGGTDNMTGTELRDFTVRQATRGIAQLILPMMDAVGTMSSELSEDEV